MRRSFSISLVLLFLLAPLASWLPGADESNLPMCCRRHGNHHCAASAGAASSTDGTHSIGAPSQCPQYTAAAPAALAAFLLPEPPVAKTINNQFQARLIAPESITTSPRTLSDRGPPSAS